jgi:hypothetical protein
MKTRRAERETMSNNAVVYLKVGECQVCGAPLYDGRRKFCDKHDIKSQRSITSTKHECVRCHAPVSDGRAKYCPECKLAIKIEATVQSPEATNLLEVKELLDQKIKDLNQVLEFNKQLLLNQESMVNGLRSVSFSLNYLIGESVRNKHHKKG